MNARAAQRGFTLVDLLVACTVAGVMAGVALPSYQAHLTKARRADAVAALMRLQAAQERHRSAHGLYGPDLATLRLAAGSDQGLYTLALASTGPDGFRATASARPDAAQAGDRDCATLTLEVNAGFAQRGPSLRCWNL